jgi:hypothetical protein
LKCQTHCALFLPDQTFELALVKETTLTLTGAVNSSYGEKYLPGAGGFEPGQSVTLEFRWAGHFAI